MEHRARKNRHCLQMCLYRCKCTQDDVRVRIQVCGLTYFLHFVGLPQKVGPRQCSNCTHPRHVLMTRLHEDTAPDCKWGILPARNKALTLSMQFHCAQAHGALCMDNDGVNKRSLRVRPERRSIFWLDTALYMGVCLGRAINFKEATTKIYHERLAQLA